MTNDPDEIRADIERTRHDLGRDVDALAEKVSPGKAVGRQTDRIKDRLSSAKESVFGSPDDDPYGSQQSLVGDARERAGDMAHQASQAVQDAPAALRRRTRGNPLAAGLIALGAGWLIASLIPASRAEQDAARAVKDQAEPLVEEAKAVAQEMGEHLRPEAEQAMESVKETAAEGVEHVKDEGQHRAEDVKAESQEAAERVRDEARDDRNPY